jgi:putative Holliday junction resolvase
MVGVHNVVALDFGDRRVGVALASLEARMPNPLLTIDRQNEDVYEAIEKVITQYEVCEIVVGLPRSMEGQETDQTTSTRHFAEELRNRFSLSVHLQDEAATSIVAEENLKILGKPYSKGDIDKTAAAYILRDWLITQQENIV